jgi:hypothetical protein
MARMRALLARLEALPARTWLWIVAGVAVLQRLLMWALYPVVPLGDSGSYRRSAEAILNGWSNYDGTRTPGYPAFMALAGADQRVYLAQLALGLAITLLFFYVGWKITGKAWFGALIALLHTLNAGQFFFEANLMTETLTTFWLALAWAGMAHLLAKQAQGPRDAWIALGVALVVGLATGLALLTRPLFIFLPFWSAFFLIIFPVREAARSSASQGAARQGRARWWGAAAAAAVLIPALVLAGLWVNFIHERFHTWSLSSMNGYHMIQHTGEFFEYVPDEYAALRDTYIKYRDARIAKYGTQANAIWDAIPELQRVSGESFYGLSRLIQKISFRLILEHPTMYLRNVALGWTWFWKVPVYWSQAAIENPLALAALRGSILFERGLLFAANLLFIAGSVALAASRKLRQRLSMTPFLWFTVGAIWIASLLQTLLDHGDNPRFSVPLQSLIVLVVLTWGLNFALSRPKHA